MIQVSSLYRIQLVPISLCICFLTTLKTQSENPTMYHLNSLIKLIPWGCCVPHGAAHAQFTSYSLTPGSYNQEMMSNCRRTLSTPQLWTCTANTQTLLRKGFNQSATNTGRPSRSSFTSAAARTFLHMEPSSRRTMLFLLTRPLTAPTHTDHPIAYNALSFLLVPATEPPRLVTLCTTRWSFDNGTFVAMDGFFNSPTRFQSQWRVDVNTRTMDNVKTNEPDSNL